jgi:hypothetical protein
MLVVGLKASLIGRKSSANASDDDSSMSRASDRAVFDERRGPDGAGSRAGTVVARRRIIVGEGRVLAAEALRGVA